MAIYLPRYLDCVWGVRTYIFRTMNCNVIVMWIAHFLRISSIYDAFYVIKCIPELLWKDSQRKECLVNSPYSIIGDAWLLDISTYVNSDLKKRRIYSLPQSRRNVDCGHMERVNFISIRNIPVQFINVLK